MMRSNQAAIVALTLKLDKVRVPLQEKLDRGASMADIALDYKVSPVTMARVLKSMGFNFGKETKHDRGKLFNDVIVVLARVAEGLNVNYDEIKPYLQVDSDHKESPRPPQG